MKELSARYYKNMKICLLSLSILFGLTTYALSHSGRTNSEGCHNQRSNGTYHCHNKKNKSSSQPQRYQKSSIRIIDGDTIYIGENKIRFSGIDAPEIKQLCELNNKLIKCGIIAKDFLEKKISSNNVRCIPEKDLDRYGRILAECFINSESLSKYMVRNGYAFAFRKYSKKFIDDEQYAKLNNLGLWKTKFEYPWENRK